jgi:hypothetical protein
MVRIAAAYLRARFDNPRRARRNPHANDIECADMAARGRAHLRSRNAPPAKAARLRELSTTIGTVKERLQKRYPPMTATP